MDQFRLNLSTRRFPAYRATNALLIAGLVLLVAVTFWQAYGFAQYSSAVGGIRGDERSATVSSEALGTRLAELEGQLNKPEAAAKLTEIGFLNGIIARRSFSWTAVFAQLEGLTPDSVHLTSLRPDVGSDGRILMHLDVRGRGIGAISDFISALEASPAFENVIVSVEEKRDSASATDVDVTLTVNYYPDKENQ